MDLESPVASSQPDRSPRAQVHRAGSKAEAAPGAELHGGAWVSRGSAQRVGQGDRKYLRLQVGRGESRRRTGSPAAHLSTPASTLGSCEPWEPGYRSRPSDYKNTALAERRLKLSVSAKQ